MLWLMLVDFKEWKLARTFLEDARTINRIMDLAIQGLEHFKHYRPVANALYELKNARTIMDVHCKKAEGVVTRGREN